ncbi:MAG: hypothetical protein A3F14_06720 [Gammaproteobacteria bacterium RIFCSPHIGHO2_12_FULL_43_28]|nr:MAG: hypothetical protein A3F14_06720 [Gammaproteobacteria bacterium RIFCSPHIGHO2_12_FULL_43_28]
MEKKLKHRILGILVILGLVIILLSVMHGRNDFPSEAALVKAPPFPDQPVQVSSEPADAKATGSEAPAAASIDDNDVIKAKPDDTIDPKATLQQSDARSATPAPDTAKADAEKPVVAENDAATKPAMNATEEADHGQQTTNLKNKLNDAKKAEKNLNATSFALQMKKSAWAIQVGSFKSKANALRLVNRLRSSGYHAFIKEASSSVRVYVGPETKKAIASMLADRIEYEMKLHGIVVSYQPLTM